jgi:hypothetical protein
MRKRLPSDPVAEDVAGGLQKLSANRALRPSQAKSKAVIIGTTTNLVLRGNGVNFTTALPARILA